MGITKEQLVDALIQTKDYVDNKSVSISPNANNAVTDSNGLFVKDLSAEISKINIAQKTVNKSSRSGLLDEPVEFTVNSATVDGTPVTTNINKTVTLNQSIEAFEYLELMFYPKTNVRLAPQLVSLRVDSIVYNNSTTQNRSNGSLVYARINAYSSSQNCFGEYTVSLEAWFMDSTTLYLSVVNNPLQTVNWNGDYGFDVYGVGGSVVIDPLEYANESDGIEDTPVGHIIAHMGTTAPKHYLACDGSSVAVADYSYLAQHFKDSFGSEYYFGGSDGMMSLPDLRGDFLRGAGANSHENQGDGGNVGEHQDATEIPYSNVNSSTAKYYYYYDDGTQSTYPAKTDSKIPTIGSVQIKSIDNTTSGTSTLSNVKYTVRPTNTSVLYCIKYEPTFYMKNTYSGNVYSTDEKVAGKWVNGKPIYQKTFTNCGNLPSSTNMTISHEIDDIDMVVSVYGIAVNSSQTIPLPYPHPDATVLLDVRVDKILVATTSSNFTTMEIKYITMQYTKTTDSPSDTTITPNSTCDCVSYTDDEVATEIDAVLEVE